MTVVVSKPINRLARMLKKPGGMTVRRALSNAGLNLEALRNDCLNTIDSTIEEMRALLATVPGRELEVAPQLYHLSNSMIGTSGTMRMVELSEAAFSLCETLDRIMQSKKWNSAPVEVHLSAISRLRLVDGNEEICKAIIDGLKRVAART